MIDDDPPEVQDLAAAAEWRMRKVDADPADHQSRAAAEALTGLAEQMRALQGSDLFKEYRAICGWLDEFDGMEDFAHLAHEYRAGIGFGREVPSGEVYLRALIALAKESFGTA
ncbi:MAG TPA: hypothetical protein VIG49_00420 [Acetobacteraceae bacterium]